MNIMGVKSIIRKILFNRVELQFVEISKDKAVNLQIMCIQYFRRFQGPDLK